MVKYWVHYADDVGSGFQQFSARCDAEAYVTLTLARLPNARVTVVKGDAVPVVPGKPVVQYTIRD